MEEWKTYKLGELLNIKYGKDHKSLSDGLFPAYGSGGIMRMVEKPIYDKPSILIPRKGSLNNIIYTDSPFWTVDTMFWTIIDNDIVLPHYLYYSIKDVDFASLNVGSAVPSLTCPIIEAIEVTIPSISIQQKILNCIEPIDEKISLNNRINHNLEEQAQALYKSWFVDFEPFKDGKFVESELGMIPEGWRVGQLSEIAKITMGQSPSGTSFNEDGNGIVFYQGRTEFGFRFPSIRLFTTEPTRYAEPDSVLLSVRAPVGDVNIASQRCCIGRGLASIESISGNSSFILYTILSLRSTLDRYNGEGTVFGSVNRKELESLSVIIPPENIQNRFEQIASTLDEEIKSKSKELNQLSESRDSLLPRLMSGEITC